MKTPPSFDDGRPSFKHAFATQLIGKHALIGITRQDAHGNLLDREQFHGEITVADSQKGVCIKLQDGGYKWLPPDTRPYQKATPGEYRLRSTGEVVTAASSGWTILS
jgi:hypothetical protein